MRSLLRASRVGLWSSIAQGRTGTRTHGTMHGQDEVVVKQHPFHYRANSRPDERQGKPIAPAVAKLSRSQLVPACAFVMLSDLTTCKSAAPGCGHSLLDSRPRPQCAAPGRGHTVCSTAGRAQLARVIVPGHWSTIPGCGRRVRRVRGWGSRTFAGVLLRFLVISPFQLRLHLRDLPGCTATPGSTRFITKVGHGRRSRIRKGRATAVPWAVPTQTLRAHPCRLSCTFPRPPPSTHPVCCHPPRARSPRHRRNRRLPQVPVHLPASPASSGPSRLRGDTRPRVQSVSWRRVRTRAGRVTCRRSARVPAFLYLSASPLL